MIAIELWRLIGRGTDCRLLGFSNSREEQVRAEAGTVHRRPACSLHIEVVPKDRHAQAQVRQDKDRADEGVECAYVSCANCHVAYSFPPSGVVVFEGGAAVCDLFIGCVCG